MGRQKNYIEDGSKVFFYRSTYPKPKNFKKYKVFNQIFCSYDIPVYTNRNGIKTLDTINLDIPYEVDMEFDTVTINENTINDYIESIIGVGLEECNVYYFKRDGAFFPFVHDISIYENQINKYIDVKKLRHRRYKLDKLRNIRKNK